MPDNYKWSPIRDLPEDYANLSDGELRPLGDVWREQRTDLEGEQEIQEFQEQLHRRWAIETGVIEQAYTLERGVTETLIREGINADFISREATDKDPVYVAAMIEDHLSVLEGLFAFVKAERNLSVGYIKELHASLLRNVKTYTVRDSLGNLSERELIKGIFKTQLNNPTRPDGFIHEYCPPEHVAAEMDNLVQFHARHAGVPPEIEAAWIHHAFTQIHPFADGNGRVARAIATLIFIKAGLFPLVITRDTRTAYILALEQADAGDLAPLVRLFVANQRYSIIQAVHSIPSIPNALKTRYAREPQTLEEQIEWMRGKLELRGELRVQRPSWNIEQTRLLLNTQLIERLTQVHNLLESTLKEVGKFRLEHLVGTGSNLKRLLFYEVRGPFNQTRLLLDRPNLNRVIEISIHGVAPDDRGLVVAEMLYVQELEAPQLINETFQANYRDDPNKVRARFSCWLDEGLNKGLAIWREQL